MTILKDGRDRQIECEECSETTSVYDSEDFEQMVGNAKDAGWAITREDGRYTHKCPDCAGVSSLTRQQALFR